MQLTITGFSTALYSTWLFIDELGLLLDCGDGVTAGMLAKLRKVKHLFISHADRDHLAGLLQFYQLNARDNIPAIHYPRDCGSLPAIRDFLRKFDPHVGPASWHGIGEERTDITKNRVVWSRQNDHVYAPDGQWKSLDFLVIENRWRLKPEFVNLPGDEIAAIRQKLGNSGVSEPTEYRMLGYSGDTPRLEPEHWEGTELLIHESTFLDPQEARSAHSNLGQVLNAAREVAPKHLVLTHFSPRYTHDQIITAIREAARREKIQFPIHAILPGQLVRDVLNTEPIWCE